MGVRLSRLLVFEGISYIPLAAAARQAGLRNVTLQKWAMRGSDPNGNPIRIIKRSNGKWSPLFVAAVDLATVSRSSLSDLQVDSRYDRRPIIIENKCWITPAQAARLCGMSSTWVGKMMNRGTVLGFNLEITMHQGRRLLLEESVLALAHILKDHPIKLGRPRLRPESTNINQRRTKIISELRDNQK